MSDFIKWELFDEFHRQGEKAEKVRSRYANKKAKLNELITEETEKLDGYIRKEALEDVDMSAEKAEARKAIAEAEKESAVMVEEQAKATEALKAAEGHITVEDLTKDWVYNYSKAVRAEELPSILRQLEEGRALILNALLDFIETQERYQPIQGEMSKTYHSFYSTYAGTRLSFLPLFSQRDIMTALIRDEDFQYVKQCRKLPNGVERKSSKGGRK